MTLGNRFQRFPFFDGVCGWLAAATAAAGVPTAFLGIPLRWRFAVNFQLGSRKKGVAVNGVFVPGLQVVHRNPVLVGHRR